MPMKAKASAGGIVAMHASPGNKHLLTLYFDPLNRRPVIGGQAVDYILPFGPVVMNLLGPEVTDGFFRNGESFFIQHPACRHTYGHGFVPATIAFCNVDHRGMDSRTGPGCSGKSQGARCSHDGCGAGRFQEASAR